VLGKEFGLIKFKAFNQGQGREISLREPDETLQEWGFKELEVVAFNVIERVEEPIMSHSMKEHVDPPKVSPCEVWVATRFDELYDLLSVDAGVELPNHLRLFLVNRPPAPKFLAKLQDSDTPWEDLFSKDHPWRLAYALFVLHDCVKSYRNGSQEWIPPFATKHHGKMVDLIEWLSTFKVSDLKTSAYIYCLGYSLFIFDGFLSIGNPDSGVSYGRLRIGIALGTVPSGSQNYSILAACLAMARRHV